MARTGRLIRANRAAALPDCVCGHGVHLHKELGYGHPEHKPGKFVCEVCACQFYEPRAA